MVRVALSPRAPGEGPTKVEAASGATMPQGLRKGRGLVFTGEALGRRNRQWASWELVRRQAV
jgi:hypothetical protein